MTKEVLTARQLADRIRERLGEPELRVGVYFDKKVGWHAVAYSILGTVAETQNRVDRAADELRNFFDWKE
jgi:hypothetical protein